nr:RNA-binding protein 3-like [Dasypus novemcinctus]
MSSKAGKLCLGGLSFYNDEQVLEGHFSSFGPISEVVVVKDQKYQRIRDVGFITFTNSEHASYAMQTMNGKSLDGHQIHVSHAGNSRGALGGHGHGHGRSYVRGCGDQGCRSSRYDSQPGGYGYGHRYG